MRRPRRPLAPDPIEVYEIVHPRVPSWAEGLRILHISDLHVRRPCGPSSALARLARALERVRVDMVALTGDYMDRPGQERAALGELESLLSKLSGHREPGLGVYGIFGNHDSAAFRRIATRELSRVRWLRNQAVEIPAPIRPRGRSHADVGTEDGLRLMGASFPEDLLGCALAMAEHPGFDDSHQGFTIALVHYPTEVYAARSLGGLPGGGVDLVLAGHTHGGQIRLGRWYSPHTSSDLPMDRASGLLRLGSTLCAVTRGLGEGVVEARVLCRPQAPIYVLRSAAISGHRTTAPIDRERLERVIAW